MTERIPKATAKLVVFKAYLASDHVTEATGKTIAITISKNGGAFGNPNAGATNATEIANGWYKVSLDTTDTGTGGPLAVRGAVATIDDVGVLLEVVNATNGGFTALPDTACTTNASLLTAGTGTSQLSVSSGQVILQAGTGAGQLDFTSGVVKANATQWLGGAIPAVNVTGVPLVDLKYTLGTISPAAAGSVRADAVTGAVGSVTGAVGSVTGAVGSVTGLTASDVGAIKAKTDNLPASPAAVGSAMTLTSGERNAIADAMLDRDMSTGTDSGSTTVRTMRQALRFLRNKWSIAAGTLTVCKEDDSTSSWTSAVTTDAAAVPIVSNDPAGP